MKLIEYFKRAFLVRKCVICEGAIDYDRKTPICDECNKYWLSQLDLLCPKCGYDCEYCICTNGRLIGKTEFLIYSIFYKGKSKNPANLIVYKLKRDYNREVIDFCAELMKNKTVKAFIKQNMSYEDFVVTYPPRRNKAVIEFGYDHAKLLAKAFAGKMGLQVIECFRNTGYEEQKSLDKNSRIENAKRSYVLLDKVNVSNKRVFIIDDVITSGSTLNVCASLLRKKGAKSVVPVCFAKDI